MTTEQRGDIRARAFYKMTGYTAPDKPEPPANGFSATLVDREQAWRRWLGAYGPAVKATLDAAEELGIA